MSFGFSIGDLAALVALTKKTYDRWQNAPKEYADVVQTLGETGMLMRHVQRRFDVLAADENNAGKQREVGEILKGCQSAVSDLREVARRRRKLGHWDRIKMGASHISDCKNRLSRRLNILTPFLFSLELESIGKDISSLPAALDRLPQILSHALPAALGKMIDESIKDSRTAKSSVMTTYGDDDDKHAYRELRRHLVSFGIKDTVVDQQRTKLVEFVRTLVQDDGSTAASGLYVEGQTTEVHSAPNTPSKLAPQVVHRTEGAGTVGKNTPSTVDVSRHQAHVKAEDGDEAMKGTAVASSIENTTETLGNVVRSQRADGDLGQGGYGSVNGVTAKFDFAHGEESNALSGNDTMKAVGRRTHQAYVETDDEDDDEDDDATLETLNFFQIDTSMNEACEKLPFEADKRANDQATTQGLSSKEDVILSETADPVYTFSGVSRTKVDVEADCDDYVGTSEPIYGSSNPRGDTTWKSKRISKTRDRMAKPRKAKSSASSLAACGDPEYRSSDESTDESLSQTGDRTATHTKPKAPASILAACGNPQCQDCLEQVSEFYDSGSASSGKADNGYCSSCDKRGCSCGRDPRYIKGSDYRRRNDAGQQFETDSNASIRAHRGNTDDEEEDHHRGHHLTNTFSGYDFDDRTERRSGKLDRSLMRPSLARIAYQPLNASEEGLLTIEVHLPAGYSIHIDRNRIAQFRSRFASNTQRRYFSLLPPCSTVDIISQCRHGFPRAPIMFPRTMCNCQILLWTRSCRL